MDDNKIIEAVKCIIEFCINYEEICSRCPLRKLCDKEFIGIPMDWRIDI